MFSLWIFIATLTAVCGQDTVRTPIISWITKDIVVDIGATVELECDVQYQGDYSVLWVKKTAPGTQDLPISINAALISPSPRYEIIHDYAFVRYRLVIRELQENDVGEYMCQVLINHSHRIKTSASVELLVRRPPVISDNSTRSVEVTEGASVRLECFAEGVPVPSISWKRENNALLPTGGSDQVDRYSGNLLVIPSIRKEDRGTYYCNAENGVGRGAMRNINVDVEFKPVVNTPRPVFYQALLFDSPLLECQVESYPPANISWIFRDESLVNDQHYTTSQFATANEFTVTTLRVRTIEKHHYGNYSCKAQNKLGSHNTTIVLYESSTPICPPACG